MKVFVKNLNPAESWTSRIILFFNANSAWDINLTGFIWKHIRPVDWKNLVNWERIWLLDSEVRENRCWNQLSWNSISALLLSLIYPFTILNCGHQVEKWKDRLEWKTRLINGFPHFSIYIYYLPTPSLTMIYFPIPQRDTWTQFSCRKYGIIRANWDHQQIK